MSSMKGRSQDPTYHVIRDIQRNLEHMDPGKPVEVLLKPTDNITPLTQMHGRRNTFKKMRDEEDVHKVLILFNTDALMIGMNSSFIIQDTLSFGAFFTSSAILLSAERSVKALLLSKF